MSALLHLVGFAPERTEQLSMLARACNEGDTLVLLDAGVAFAQPRALATLQQAVPGVRILVLQDEHMPEDTELETLDHPGLIMLTETHRGPASWY